MEATYIVTGAAGHLGRTVTQMSMAAGKDVRALVLPGEAHPPACTALFYGDVRDRTSLAPLFAGLSGRETILIHCAGIVSIQSRFSQAMEDVNVGGTQNIIALCREHGIGKLVHVSSVHAIKEVPHGVTITETKDFHRDKVVGHYAKTKATATALVLDAAREGLPACIVHPSGITGPYDHGRGHLTTLIVDYAKRRLTAGIHGGYDFVDVRDVAQGILSVAERGKPGECYILSGRYAAVSEILTLLHEITGQRRIRTFLPLWFVKLTAPLAEMYYRILRQPPLYTAYSIYTLGSSALFSHEKATRELGYTTRDLATTLKDTVDWLKAAGRL